MIGSMETPPAAARRPEEDASWPRPWLPIHEQLGLAPPPFDDKPLGAFVEGFAQSHGDRPALLFAGAAITYAQLDEMASRLGGALAAQGIAAGDVVGLHLPNVPQYVAALVALSKIGAVGSGVSPLLAPPELAHQLRDSAAKAVLTLSPLAPALAAMPDVPSSLDLVVVTGPADALAPGPQEKPTVGTAAVLDWTELMATPALPARQGPVEPDATAMLQYTGGTTGRSKGAELSHRTLIHNPRQYTAHRPYEIGAEVIATAFPLFHIAGLTAAINALMHAATLTLVPDPRDVDAFVGVMQAHPPTALSAVPALYEMLLAHPGFAEIDWSKLHTAATGAAPMPLSTARRLAGVVGEGKLSDAFGMTETGPCYTFHPPAVRREGAIGIPMPGAEVRIVDVETGTKDMPFGEPGEIISAGPQLMKGYRNLPEESARAIRHMDGERWMFSGDVGTMDEDGYITLCDRAKDMLIVGGFKVFSVEVEDHLKSLPVVAASAIVGTPDEARPGNDVVNLFVQLSEAGRAAGEAQAVRMIEAFFRETMAPYKAPKRIHVVDAIPLTPVGKIDKKVLRAQAAETQNADA